jgi:phytoene/squalene synthetase
MVLRAFNAELAQIPDSVKQETLVQIRMQWWRDAVKSAYSDRPEPNPIILALHEVCEPQCADAVASSNLSRENVLRFYL